MEGHRLKRDPSSFERCKLTCREMQVLSLVAQDKSNGDIGRELGISESTVKIHLSNVFSKLGATNRNEAVLAAATRRLAGTRG